jgi:hypothetical protein
MNFESIKPYLPARMSLSEMTQVIKNGVLDSPVFQDLKIKSDVLLQLKKTLLLLIPSEGEMPDATQIKKQVDVSGINYESKVRKALQANVNSPLLNELAGDLKGLLLKLYHSSDNSPASTTQSTPINDFRKTIKQAIDNVELNQLSNQLSKQENQPLVLQIPNPLSSKNKTIQLFVCDGGSESAYEKKKGKDKKNVAFFLDLSALGKLNINAQMSSDSLSVNIDVESEEIANFIRTRKDTFEKKMNETKFNTCVECNVSKKVEPFKDSLIKLLVNKNTSLVNIKT